MSTSLVKKSLSLFDDDLQTSQWDTKKKKKTDNDNPMSMISSRKQGVRKELRRLKSQAAATSAAKANISIVQQKAGSDRCKQVDLTEKSVRALKRMAQIKSTNKEVSKVVFDHHQSRKKRKQEEKPKVDNSTAFTNDDFEKFAETFDFSALK